MISTDSLGIKRKMSGWGNYPIIESKVSPIYSVQDIYLKKGGNLIARGLGRSYGDSAISELIADILPMDRFLSFDNDNGEIHCQAGVSLGEILSIIVPKGWFLPVTPGTKFITVGGAVAADVHGKNHHIDGSFCDYVDSFKIMIGNGKIIECTTENNSDLFFATCGGMGLTGIILDVRFRLKSIKGEAVKVKTIRTSNLEDTLDIFEENKSVTYSVAWIDCLKKGKHLGRSHVMLGEHCDDEIKSYDSENKMNIPFYTPSFLLNKCTIKVFNAVYYQSQPKKDSVNVTHYQPFFYPLDAINNWNRLYGKKGFFQYQFVLPFSVGLDGIKRVMTEIVKSGQGSFLAVLKTFGSKNNNLISFPMAGYTLALDIKYNQKALTLFNFLDNMIAEMGGRHYLAKDARMSAETFKATYKNWEKFQDIRRKYYALGIFSSNQSIRIGLD